MESWAYLIEQDGREPGFNMGFDEAMMLMVDKIKVPIIRFYLWKDYAATFGLLQRYVQVSRYTSIRPLIRRPTGGGLVIHGNDWTYSIAIPPTHNWYRIKAINLYKLIHSWLANAFIREGISVSLASTCFGDKANICFAKAEKYDLIWQDCKIGGAAQRRSKYGLLVQGSIIPPLPVNREQWIIDVLEVGKEMWGINWIELTTLKELETFAKVLEEQKYNSLEYTTRY